MIALSSRSRQARAALVLAGIMVGLTACTSAPAAPTPALKTDAKPTAAATMAPSPASSPVAAPSPSPAGSPAAVASPVAVASPATMPSPSPAASLAPVSSPAPAASPAAAVPSPVPVVGASSSAGRVTAIFTLPDTPIATFQNAKLPGSIANDRKMLLGGIGSDLWHQPGDPLDTFWMITDRGPNGQVLVDTVQRRTFPIPEFTPTIIKVRTTGERIEIVETIPIVGQSGRPVSGVSNLDGKDEAPYDFSAMTRIDFNPNGMDTEGLVRLSNGDFWVADENSPSLVKIDPSGKVVKRYVPQGLSLPGTDYPVADTLPAIYGKRKISRGFEGLAVSPDEQTLYLALQSPLLNPDAATGNPSRMTRILAFDIAAEKASAEYAYRFDAVGEFDTTAARPPAEMKLSGAIVAGPGALLILERTDWVAKIYRVELSQADNILGTPWDDQAMSPSLEATVEPAGLKLLPKTLMIDLDQIAGMPDKIEGIALLDRNTLVVANDNDFDIGPFGPDGNNVGAGVKSRILVIALTTPVALP